MIEIILIVSGVFFWFMVLFVAGFFFIEKFDEWRLKRIFQRYEKRCKEREEAENKAQKGEDI